MLRSPAESPMRAGILRLARRSLAGTTRADAVRRLQGCVTAVGTDSIIRASLVRLCCAAMVVLAASLITTCAPRAELRVEHAESECLHKNPVSTSERAAKDLAAPFAPPDHVVVIAIDGVRWQEVFRGVDPRFARTSLSTHDQSTGIHETVPVLHQIACTRGVLLGNDHSRVFVSSPATVSLPGYSELFGGRTPTCAHNECPATREPTLLDAWRRSDEAATLAVVSSWAKIPNVAAMDRSRLMITAGRSATQNLEPLSTDPVFDTALRSGRSAPAAPGIDDYRPDRFTADVGLRLLQLAQPSFLFLGLGDTDEYAHQGDYGAYVEALRFADSVVGRVDRLLTELQSHGKQTLLVVTTDHGRAASFRNHTNSKEAARIWMLWSGSAIHARGYPAIADTRLADLSPTIRQLMRLGTDHDRRAGRALLEPLGIEPSHWGPEADPFRGEFATVAASP